MAARLEPLQFDEAIEAFAEKVAMPIEAFYSLEKAVRNRAFAIAGVTRMDVCDGIYQAVLKAIEDGETLADFQGRVDELFQTLGFTSEDLTPWRLETIFRTNIQTAYNVGRYRQMEEMSAQFPYWEYDAVNDSATRPEHAALDGKIFPADHPFWDTWYPPNGFNCRCSVNPVHKYVAEEEGLTIETEDPTGKLFEPVDKNGNKLPARALNPDPGFKGNPAKDPWNPDLSKYPAELRSQFEKEKKRR